MVVSSWAVSRPVEGEGFFVVSFVGVGGELPAGASFVLAEPVGDAEGEDVGGVGLEGLGGSGWVVGLGEFPGGGDEVGGCVFAVGWVEAGVGAVFVVGEDAVA